MLSSLLNDLFLFEPTRSHIFILLHPRDILSLAGTCHAAASFLFGNSPHPIATNHLWRCVLTSLSPDLASFLSPTASFRTATRAAMQCRWHVSPHSPVTFGQSDWRQARVLHAGAKLIVDGKQTWSLPHGCGTCSKWFEKQAACKLTDQLSTTLDGAVDVQAIAAQFGSLLVEDRYAVVVRMAWPVLISEEGDSRSYYENEWKTLWKGHHSIRNDPRPPVKGPFYQDRHFVRLPTVHHSLLVPMVLPLQELGSLDLEQVKKYEEQIKAGEIPTAVAIGSLHRQGPWASMEESDYLSHVMFLQSLLDGHHKLQAAANVQGPVAIITLIGLGDIDPDLVPHTIYPIFDIIGSYIPSVPREPSYHKRVLLVQNLRFHPSFENDDPIEERECRKNLEFLLQDVIIPSTSSSVVSISSPAAVLGITSCRLAVVVFKDSNFALPKQPCIYNGSKLHFSRPEHDMTTPMFHLEIRPPTTVDGDPIVEWLPCSCDSNSSELYTTITTSTDVRNRISRERQDEQARTCVTCGYVASNRVGHKRHMEQHLFNQYYANYPKDHLENCFEKGVLQVFALLLGTDLESAESRTCTKCGALLPRRMLIKRHMEKHAREEEIISFDRSYLPT